jgi:hypothetical protein
MLDILGESLATGRVSFAGGTRIPVDNDHGSPNDIESPEEPANIHTRPSTPDTDPADPQLPETHGERRARESGPPPAKKRKVSGLSIMEKMGEGITAVASAMTQAPEAPKETVENVGSTLQGQAQQKVQTEVCLTEEGLLLMLDQLTDPALARTYLSITKDGLRLRFLKRQVEKFDSNCFINPIC